MGMERITFSPGINAQRTRTLNKGGWSASNLIRFREGLPEVKGGWLAFLLAPLQGPIRALHAWSTLAGIATLGAGTSLRLYVCQGGTGYDVTPIIKTNALSGPFVTVNASSTITVNDATAPVGMIAGNYIEVSGASAVAGITLAGEYVIASVISPTQYTISVAPLTANAGATGGGSPSIAYLLGIGAGNAVPGQGWGVGRWGRGSWGTARAGVAAGVIYPRLWTVDNWGENMIACPRNAGGIYQWVATTGVTVRAALLAGAPTIANGAVVAAPIQMVIAWGCNPPAGGTQDPMLLAWSDVGDNTNWTPTVADQAGSFRLNSGSQIMQVIPVHQQLLVWTDTSLYGMQYIQPPLIWGFNQLAASCGSVSPNAAGVLGGVAFWMGSYEFWMYNGQAVVVDCPLRDQVFKNLNRGQQSKVCCVINTEWTEVTWHYPSLGSKENDSSITLNLNEMQRSGPLNCWHGSGVAAGGPPLTRTAGIDDSIFGFPIGADDQGNVWSEEQGYTENGAFMPWSILSGFVDIADGEDYSFLDLIIPDQILSGGSCAYTVFSIINPADTPRQYGPFIVGPGTRQIPNGTAGLRVRARAIALQIDNSPMAIGNFWRMGAPRARVAKDGRQ